VRPPKEGSIVGMGPTVLATIRHQQPLALVGDRQVMCALWDMPHKMALDGGKAGPREHLLLLLPGRMDCAPAHLAILIVYPRPEQRLAKFCQCIRIGEVQIQEDSRPF